MTATTAINYAIYQAGWFACILGAAWGGEAGGAAIAVTLITVHVWLTRERGLECRLIALAAVVGYLVETTQILLGTYEARSSLMPPGTPPVWLLVLWAQFATTFRYCLDGILGSPARAALFGALGGPVAFVAADRLGALDLLAPVGAGLLKIAVLWTVALLLFSRITGRWSPRGTPAYRQMPGRR